MSKVIVAITTSIDGYVAGPDDGPGVGLGVGGERLHYWLFGGPWTYEGGGGGEMETEDKIWLDSLMSQVGAVIGGRDTYEAGGHWGDVNPFDVPLFIVTHRPEEQPPGDEFLFVAGVEEAIARATDAADGKNVYVMGGAAVFRQALSLDLVDELTMIIAPVVLGGGKRLFDGFANTVDLEQLGVRQSEHATFVEYRIVRSSIAPVTPGPRPASA